MRGRDVNCDGAELTETVRAAWRVDRVAGADFWDAGAITMTALSSIWPTRSTY
jgi:hypothetical protein